MKLCSYKEKTKKNKCFQNCIEKKNIQCMSLANSTLRLGSKARSPIPASSIAIKIDTAHHLHDLGDDKTHQLLPSWELIWHILKSCKLDILESGNFPVLPVWWDMMPLLPFEGNIEPENCTKNRWDM